MYAYIYVCMYVYTYVYVHDYLHMYRYMYVRVYPLHNIFSLPLFAKNYDCYLKKKIRNIIFFIFFFFVLKKSDFVLYHKFIIFNVNIHRNLYVGMYV